MMDVPFLKLIFYFLLLNSFINLASFEVDRPVYFNHSCTITKNFTSDSPFQYNRDTLFSSLCSSKAPTTVKFYKASVGTPNNAAAGDPAIYGEFMCREDVPIDVCRNCVQDATSRIKSECPNNREAIIWYDYCFVRYSDRYFFSSLQQIPTVSSFSEGRNMGNAVSLIVTSKLGMIHETELRKALYDVAAEAAASTKKFATKEMNLTSLGSVYCLVQCTPDLSQRLCSECLRDMIKLVPQQNDKLSRGRIVNPSCNLMFNQYQFYYQGNQTAPFLAQEPGHPSYQHYNCSFTKANHAYLNNLKSLTLEVSNSSNIPKNNGFYTNIVGKNSGDTIYALFMCRGDVSLELCHECVNEGFGMLNFSCSSSKEAIVWYDMCMVRYSNRSFFSTLDTQPRYTEDGWTLLENQKAGFNSLLADTLNDLVEETPKSMLGVKYFGTKNASSLSVLQALYSLAQCTPNLARKDCQKCLEDARQQIKECCLGKKGGQTMNPSCNLRFETYPFYNDSIIAVSKPQPNPQSPKVSVITGKDGDQFRTILITVSVIVVSIILSGFGLYYWKRKQSKSFKAILKKIFGSEGATLESLQFNLATIEAATDKFSTENRIGRGGFGEVYMGTLADGRKIAVKRLSRNSSQGLSEFKAEILLIAKLQHRNLVALLGFCLKDQEKILVYEYVPNKSLDYFLFGSQKSRVLNWSERYNIIGGVARGILYLHEYSRLKVIHRDLKPSNILLDDEMNPKISDFGLARMVGIDETIKNTRRVVGTWGYMSPEYVKFGEFSDKSDVFSFGVIVLEIISGKNVTSHSDGESQYSGGLLTDVWKHWRDENLIAIVDSNLTEAEPHSEMIRCIHIGLLCVQGHPQVRPSMNEVVKYLSNDSMQLPIPKEPAFFIHSQMEQATTSRAMAEAQIPNHNQYSINELSESTLFPR